MISANFFYNKSPIRQWVESSPTPDACLTANYTMPTREMLSRNVRTLNVDYYFGERMREGSFSSPSALSNNGRRDTFAVV